MMRAFGLLAFLVAIVSMASCRMRAVEVTAIDSFSVSTISEKGLEGDIRVSIRNPNRIGFKIAAGQVAVDFAGARLGNAKLSTPVKIGAGKEATYTFHIVSDFSSLSLGDILRVLQGGIRNEPLEINGTVTARHFPVTKRLPVSVKAPVKIR
jgi:hypothetical protein